MGGGPAGLYFAILMKKADPAREVVVLERNKPDDTFGFGVVFSDATLEGLANADRPSYDAILGSFAHWDDIDIHLREGVITSTGHGFSGLGRQALLDILQRRAAELGVEMRFETEVVDVHAVSASADLVLAADGVNSAMRAQLADRFQPSIDWRPNRFCWLGTSFPFRAFTFYFKQSEHGLFRVHAYRYDRERSTFIVECTEDAWRRAGLDSATEEETIAYCERLFAEELAGHRLVANRSIWRSFPIVRNACWHAGNVVLVGDAAHTAHFSIGSGTKLAMEDVIALAEAVEAHPGDVPAALVAYEAARRPVVESTQRAARVSLEWFEQTERYMDLPPLQLATSLLTRSLRVNHENLRVRDPQLVARIDRWFADQAFARAGVAAPSRPTPPMFTPLRLRDLVLGNRVVVSPMCMYSATDGTVNDWHLVHLGSRAVGGAGLVIAEMTDVSADGRISPGCAGMYTSGHVGAWRRIVDFVHRFTTAHIGLQLGHAGRKGSTQRLWEQPDQPLSDGNWALLAPSPIPYLPTGQTPREMTRADMDQVRSDFVRSTEMAVESGFDLLELHFAHGYLLASFLSPLTNRRTDAYGGSLEARLRYPLEIVDAVRRAWPAERPLSVRISATDWAPGGTDAADAVAIARALASHGCDIVDVSTGQTVAEARPEYGRLYQTPFAERIRLEAGVPVMTVGAISTWSDVNSVLAAGRADLCVLARAHLWDPYWTHHAARDQGYAMPWPAQYAPMERYSPRPR
ncbi:MAG: bifunctional salicylyl-CoA 5-hydroxylase/oxidoreductase [Deltaproteobacteria bacterium]|nr:bifunctional salicylyl-CoA 5-hydroxylase/oxidoreductase [Deltaproteobacteria bacterium]